MKNKIFLTIIFILTLILSACAANTNNEPIELTANENNLTEPASRARDIDMLSLMIGTFKLDGTELAVTYDQANEMLPYWKLLKNMLSDGTAAQAEIDAVVEEINSIFTIDQLSIINDLEIESDNLKIIMDELGIQIGGRGENSGSDAGSIAGEARPGVIPGQGGGQGAGGGSLGGEIELSPEQQATREASAEERSGFGITIVVNDAVIAYLESIIE